MQEYFGLTLCRHIEWYFGPTLGKHERYFGPTLCRHTERTHCLRNVALTQCKLHNAATCPLIRSSGTLDATPDLRSIGRHANHSMPPTHVHLRQAFDASVPFDSTNNVFIRPFFFELGNFIDFKYNRSRWYIVLKFSRPLYNQHTT